MIKSRAAKVQSKVSHQATSAFFLSVYSVILYAMKFVEIMIQVLPLSLAMLLYACRNCIRSSTC